MMRRSTLFLAMTLATGLASEPSTPAQAQTTSRETPVRVVSAAKYKTIDEALARERYLYIPPGFHKIDKPIDIRGWRGGLIFGAGRLTTTLVPTGKEPVLRFVDCRNVLIANLSIDPGPGPKEGEPMVELAGSEPLALTFAGVTIGGGLKLVKGKQKSTGEGGRVGLHVAAPGKIYLQGCHFTTCTIGLQIANAGAAVTVLGGNFQSEQIHIRQTQGWLQARSIGFQRALADADIEIHSAYPGRPHLMEGCRSEGLDTFLRVPNTKAAINVVLKANSLSLRRVASYGGCGTLVVCGNNQNPVIAKVGIEAPASSGPCQIDSYGNYYGNGADAQNTFVLGPKVRASSIGDLWKAPAPEPKGKQHYNRVIDAAAYKEARRNVPAGLTFPRQVPSNPLLRDVPHDEPVTLPPIANIDEMFANVKNHGVVGDGRTDDSEALARALKAEQYKPLFFPAGQYRLSKALFLDHWKGGTFWGEGPDKSVLVSSGSESAVRTNGCAYATFVGLAFQAARGGTAPAFDLNWDNSAVPGGGPALQANLFYHCRFQGGVSSLEIGKGGFMGSENLLVGCTLQDAQRGMSVDNYNALTNTALGCLYTDLNIGVQQNSGSFNLYDCTLRNVREAGVVLLNSAADTFVLERLTPQNTPCLLRTTHTGAPINVLVQHCRLPRAGRELPAAIKYSSGGTVAVLDTDLADRRIEVSGGIAHSTFIPVRTPLGRPTQVEIRGLGRGYVASPR
jgi:hypothetical protein